jgi:hypothetical protein
MTSPLSIRLPMVTGPSAVPKTPTTATRLLIAPRFCTDINTHL